MPAPETYNITIQGETFSDDPAFNPDHVTYLDLVAEFTIEGTLKVFPTIDPTGGSSVLTRLCGESGNGPNSFDVEIQTSHEVAHASGGDMGWASNTGAHVSQIGLFIALYQPPEPPNRDSVFEVFDPATNTTTFAIDETAAAANLTDISVWANNAYDQFSGPGGQNLIGAGVVTLTFSDDGSSVAGEATFYSDTRPWGDQIISPTSHTAWHGIFSGDLVV